MATSPTKTGASGAADLLWGEKSLPERFPGISGKELMEKIVEMYQVKDGETVPWFTPSGERNIVRHHLNLRKQTSVKRSYKRSICAYGVLDGCRSQAWLCQPAKLGQPFQAITFGTLSEAFYEAHDEDASNRQVVATKKSGLKNCKIFSEKTPSDVLSFLKDISNRFHGGSGISYLELVSGVHEVDQAYRSFMDRKLVSVRHSDRQHFNDWIAGSQYKERYTGQTFKVAKALRSKLNSMQILKQWEDFFGEWTDFLAPEINNGRILAVMNELGVMIESYTCGQSAAYQGLIFMELAKMCVPLIPMEDGEKHRTPPFYFTKGAESSLCSDAALKLGTPIAGAEFLTKLVPTDKGSKKRMKAPDLVDESEAVPKKKAKGQAKAKPKSKAKAKAGSNPFAETVDSVAMLEEDIAMGESCSEGARPRRWLDDLLAALEKANAGPLEPLNVSPHGKVISNAISLALEFALTAKLTVAKKSFKEWSKVRPFLQTSVRAAIAGPSSASHSRPQPEEGDGHGHQTDQKIQSQSLDDIVRSVFDGKGYLITAKCFVTTNNTVNTKAQPAYQDYISKVKVAVCTCDPNKWNPPECRFHHSEDHTVMDLLWGLDEIMRIGVPKPANWASAGIVPNCLGMVGTACLASATMNSKAPTAEGGDPGSGSNSSNNKTIKLSDLVGKDGAFLVGQDEDGSECFKASLVESLISFKIKYLVTAMLDCIHVPGPGKKGSNIDKDKYINFTDIKYPGLLDQLLGWLVSTADGGAYMVEFEARYNCSAHGCAGDRSDEAWSSLWAKTIKTALANAEPIFKEDAKTPIGDWTKFLPSCGKVIPKSFLPVLTSSTPSSGGENGEPGVKDEGGGDNGKEKGEGHGDKDKGPTTTSTFASSSWNPTAPSLSSIYNMHELPDAKDVNCLDVVSIGHQIQVHMMTLAMNPEHRSLLEFVNIDLKNQASININTLGQNSDIMNLEQGNAKLKLGVFGSITTESGPKNVKVASCVFGGKPINFYMHGDSWNKATSLAPCGVWMFKSSPSTSEKKALFKIVVGPSKTVSMADAHGHKRDVTLDPLFAELRTQAVLQLIEQNKDKAADAQQNDVLCTRTPFHGEFQDKDKGSKKASAAKYSLMLGGLAFASGNNKVPQPKAEADISIASSEELYLFKTTPLKIAAHLLK